MWWKKLARLFVIKTRWEAWFIIYALGLGASERGFHYVEAYPGWIGYLFFAACTGAVFMAGAKLLDATRPRNPKIERRSPRPAAVASSASDRRRWSRRRADAPSTAARPG